MSSCVNNVRIERERRGENVRKRRGRRGKTVRKRRGKRGWKGKKEKPGKGAWEKNAKLAWREPGLPTKTLNIDFNLGVNKRDRTIQMQFLFFSFNRKYVFGFKKIIYSQKKTFYQLFKLFYLVSNKMCSVSLFEFTAFTAKQGWKRNAACLSGY